MRTILILILSALSVSAYAADAPTTEKSASAKPAAHEVAPPVPAYALVKEKSSIRFFAIENGASIEGQFTDFTTDVHFDPERLDDSAINATVKTGSVQTANEDAQKNLKLPEWLSADAFPTATFTSGKLSRMPMSENYYTEGKLTLRGKTMPVVMNFQLKTYDKTAIATGYMTIKRVAFGVGQGEWAKDDVIKDDVRLEFRIVEEQK